MMHKSRNTRRICIPDAQSLRSGEEKRKVDGMDVAYDGMGW
jgi:hypothetical protein